MNGTTNKLQDSLRSSFLCLKTYLAQKYPETSVATLWNKWNSCKIKVHWREFSPYPPRGSKYQEKGSIFVTPQDICSTFFDENFSLFRRSDVRCFGVFFYRAMFFFFSSMCIFLVPLKRNGSRPKKCHFKKNMNYVH